MGGLSCVVPRFAVLPAETIPTDPKALPEFDRKLRECFAQSDVVAGIVDANLALGACSILKKPTWTMDERTKLFDMLDSLYTGGGY